MKPFIIPSVFTAVDRLSGPLRKMTDDLRDFNKVSASQQRLKAFARGSAMIGTAIAAPLAIAVNEASKFETALASFRTIVSDLSDSDFAKYEGAIKNVGSETKKTYTEVAQSFEKIAGLNAKFAETAEGISAVSKASIVLSRASGMDLGQSAENLVGIMNQFSLSADQADRAINVLAAGQAAGAATINQTAESFANVGSVAAGANITLEQSVGLIQTLGKFSVFGAEAGTKLRGAILRLQRSGVGYKSGQFQINDAIQQTNERLNKLSSAKQRDAYLNKLFGAENISTGRILLSNIDTYKGFVDQVTGTTEAHKAAAITQKTFAERLKAAKSQAVNLAVNVGEKLLPALTRFAEKVIPVIERLLRWTTQNPETTKTIVKMAAGIALLSYGLSALSPIVSIATKAISAYNTVAAIAGAMNPYVLIAAGVAALAYSIYKLSGTFHQLANAERLANEVRQRALENTIDQRVEVSLLFSQIRKATAGSEQYNDVLKKIEAINPEITKQYNLQAGAIETINAAEKALIDNIMKRAEEEARAELLREKTKQLLTEQMTGPSGWDSLTSFLSWGLGGAGGFTAEQAQASRVNRINEDISSLVNQITSNTKEAVSPGKMDTNYVENLLKKTQQGGKLDIFVHDKNGATTVTSTGPGLNPKITPSFMF